MKEFWSLNRNLQLRIVIVFLAAFSYGTVFSSMTIYYNQHVGATITGAFLALSALATFVAGLLAGYWSDKHGRKPVMTSGTFIQAAGALVALFSNLPHHVNPWTTFIGFLLISFGFNLDVTSGSAMIIDDSTAENRKVVFMLNYWAQNLSVIIGAALGAWLFKPAFLALLGILLTTIIVMLVIIIFMITETFTPVKDKKPENIFKSYRSVVTDKTYMIFMLANILTTMIIMQFDNFLPVHLSNSFQTLSVFGFQIYGQRMLTIYLILACVMVVVLMTTLNKWTHAWSHRKGFIFGSIFMTLGMIVAFMTTTFTPIFISGIIYTFGEIIYTPSAQSLGADLMAPEKIGAYNGVGAIRQPLASIIAAGLVSISPIIKAFGVSLVLVVTEILAITLCMLAVARHQQRKEGEK
ncbi:MDR family MFS transporter [Lactococcus nasutitermitis]|uniref:MDR family MFS transporter n=1 Tax=Lactococcus nasutitermitis TaxID=1652957 RepID=A0ABV9JIK8_9LACT|nr:MFS transporter [Lactococcus nasutitermitis]